MAAPLGRARPSSSGAAWRRRAGVALLVLALLPSVLVVIYAVVPPPVTPLMLKRLAQGQGLDRNWVPLEAISPWLPRAVAASEDNNFCRHFGFDLGALRAQVDRLLAGASFRGASTITQQTAKNIVLWEGGDPVRKLLEAWLAPQIELLWSKRRIVEVYLNVAEFGPGVYGAEAAARRYFGKPAAALSRREAALLAVVLPAPLRWSAAEPTRYIRGRAEVIQTRIGQLGPALDCLPAAS